MYFDVNKVIPTTSQAERYDQAFLHIAQVLSSGIVPADLRAALYRVATRIPGVVISDSAANLDGRGGIAVGRVDSSGNIRQDIIFDSAGGHAIGERVVLLHANTNDDLYLPTPVNAPNGSIIESTAIALDVTGNPNLR